MSDIIRQERTFKLIDGSELIETEERILFSRIGTIPPILTDANAEIDVILDTLYAAQQKLSKEPDTP